MSLGKEVQEQILNRATRKGFKVESTAKGYAITAPDGTAYELTPTSKGINCLKRITPDLPPGESEDGSGRTGNPFTIFGDDLSGRKLQNVLSQAAKNLGLDLRDHPKKEKAARLAAKAEAEAAEDKEPEVDKASEPPEESPMKAVVDEIMESFTDVTKILHEAVLQQAREDDCPTYVHTDGKTYRDWTGEALPYLEGLYDEFDRADTEQMARLEAEVPRFLSRSGRLVRLTLGRNEDSVWRVLEPEPGYVKEAPSEPDRKPDRKPGQKDDVRVVIVDGRKVNIYTCKQCAFSDYSKQSVTLHSTQIRDHGGGVHPDTSFTCPFCPVVKNTAPTLAKHIRKHHAPLGELCDDCTERDGRAVWFDDTEGFLRHRKSRHSGEMPRPRPSRRRSPVGKPAPEPVEQPAPEPLSATEKPAKPDTKAIATTGTPEPSEALSGPVVRVTEIDENLQRTVLDMMAAYPQLVATNRTLAEEASQLRAELEKEKDLRLKAEGKLKEIAEAQEALARVLGR